MPNVGYLVSHNKTIAGMKRVYPDYDLNIHRILQQILYYMTINDKEMNGQMTSFEYSKLSESKDIVKIIIIAKI